MKIYKVMTNFRIPTIEEKECVRVSDKSVFFENNHVLRESWGCNFFETHKEAVEFAIESAQIEIEGREADIRNANSVIEQCKDFIAKTRELL